MKRKSKPKWKYAYRSGLVVSVAIMLNFLMSYSLGIISEITVKNVLLALVSGAGISLIEIARMYRIKLTPNFSVGVKHGTYTMILTKVI